MRKIEYQEFEIEIFPLEKGKRYQAVAKCDLLAGSSQCVPFDMTEIAVDSPPAATLPEQSMPHITINVDEQTQKLPLLFNRPFDKQKAKTFGDRLFKAVFKDTIRTLFDTCVAKSKLRLRFNLSYVPELAALPWEYLHNSDKDHFFAQFQDTPIVRTQSELTAIVPLKVKPPVRILVMTSIPKGYDELDVKDELDSIRKGLERININKAIEVEMLSKATMDELRDKLEEAARAGKPFHILHFIGHGVFDPQIGEGALLLEDDNGEARLISGDEFGGGLREFKENLRLVVLNSCEGARASTSNSYSGFAQKVMQCAEIPAAIGMQFKISDEAAISFAESFYRAIAKGMPLESALANARMRLFTNSDEEWATPTLYLRATDGYILDTDAIGPIQPIAGQSPDLTEHVKTVCVAFDDGQLSIFLGLNVNLCGRTLLPTWKPGKVLPTSVELSDYLRDQYESPLVGATLARLAQNLAIKDVRFRIKLPLEFRESFTADAALPPLYPYLAEIVSISQKRMEDSIARDPLRRHFIIVTTNYDDCIERAFRAHKVLDDYHIISYDQLGRQGSLFRHALVKGKQVLPSVPIENPQGYTLMDNLPVILKLPGAVESGTRNFAITEDDFFALASRVIETLPSTILGKLNSSAHLYLGYTPRDWYFRNLLYAIWQSRECTQSWAVVPDDKDEDIFYWKACKVEVVTASLDDYVGKLRDALKYARKESEAADA